MNTIAIKHAHAIIMDSPVPLPAIQAIHCGNSMCISPVSIHLKDDGSAIVDNGIITEELLWYFVKE